MALRRSRPSAGGGPRPEPARWVLPVPVRPELRRRLPRLVAGLVAFGAGIALMVRSGLGLGPWDVLHQGLSLRTGIPIGTTAIFVGVVVLLAFWPLRERPGIGTLANTVVIGAMIDLTLPHLPEPTTLAVQAAYLAGGILGVAAGSGAYIGAGLGPGPRDGLMTGLVRRTGASVRLVRTGIELGALGIGILLGGTFGIGTIVFAVTIGPLVQVFLRPFSLPPLADPLPAGAPPRDTR